MEDSSWVDCSTVCAKIDPFGIMTTSSFFPAKIDDRYEQLENMLCKSLTVWSNQTSLSDMPVHKRA